MTQIIARMPDAVRKTGLSRSTIYSLMAKNKFVPKIQISERAIGFLESDIDEWITNLAEGNQRGE